WEHPRAPRPRSDRVLGQPSPDGRARYRADDPARDGFAGQFSRRPARQRPPGLGQQLARQRLDLGDLGRESSPGAWCKRALVSSVMVAAQAAASSASFSVMWVGMLLSSRGAQRGAIDFWLM